MSSLHFICNPVAGNGASKTTFEAMEALLRERGVEYTSVFTEYPGHARQLAREALAAGHACIVAVGGDGTVREVAEEMAGFSVPMGILPAGTGNDMARPLRIPQDPRAALDILQNGKTVRMDAAQVNGKLFFNVGGLGFDVDVLLNTERYKKNHRGMTAYILGLLSALIHLKQLHVRVTTPEGTRAYKAIMVVVCNGTHFGGGMNVAPLADTSDGLFDVCVAHDVNRFTLLFLLAKFIKGKHVGLRVIDYFKAAEVSVACTSEAPIQVDGEVVSSTPAAFRILPGALLVKTGM